MSAHRIALPPRVFEEHLPKMLGLLRTGDDFTSITIDISNVRFLTPAALVTILACCHRWRQEGKALSLAGTGQCESLGYLQRIDFLRHLGVELDEDFRRRPEANRFVPVRSLTFASGSVDQTASEITRCVFPDAHVDDDVFQALQYAAGELLSNAKYHSGGRAFVCSQYFPERSLVRIAVADDGQGIRRSFEGTTRETDADTAANAIELALEPQVSSANLRPLTNPYGGRNHRGVGLTITRILAKEAGGRLIIASEDGWFDESHGERIALGGTPPFFPGTLVSLTLHRDQIADYAAMHASAMAEIGMAPLDNDDMFVD